MSLHIDIKYITLLSSRLGKFSRKKDYLYNFRCPYCGDSERNPNKARGFLYRKKSDMFYKCHNCGKGTTTDKFIKFIDSELHKQYVMERFQNSGNGFAKVVEPTYDFPAPVFTKLKSEFVTSVTKLDDDHVGKQYLTNRKIPLEELYYTNDFGGFVDDIVPEKYPKVVELNKNEERIVIPFYDQDKNLTHFQGRSIHESNFRYITIRIDDDFPKVFGIERLDFEDTVYIVEGPFDSLFLPNCIAMAGSDGIRNDKFYNERITGDMVFVFDNECRNSSIVDKMEKIIDDNYKLCIWPSTLIETDINDMILSGKTPKQIINIINSNTYWGMTAKLTLNNWKRVSK